LQPIWSSFARANDPTSEPVSLPSSMRITGQPCDLGSNFAAWMTRVWRGVVLGDGYFTWNQIRSTILTRLGLLVVLYFAFLILV